MVLISKTNDLFLHLSLWSVLLHTYCLCVHRPFQRTVTMHKDSSGHVGFIYKSGKITSLVKDGSAARNGLLTEHYICEINGQNVIGLKVSKPRLTGPAGHMSW